MKKIKKELFFITLLLVSIFIKSSFLFSISLFFISYLVLFRIVLKRGLLTTEIETHINNSNIVEGTPLLLEVKVNIFSSLPVIEVLPQIPVFFISSDKRNLIFSPIFRRKENFRLKLISKKRGKYTLGKVKIRTYDPLGFIRMERVVGEEKEVYVFPKIIKISRPKIPVREPSFGIRVKEKIFEDYTSLVGVRDYSSNEDIRKIHWKISAHKRRLMVKEFPPTAITEITLIVEAIATEDRRNEEIFLNHVSTVSASLFNYFEFVKFKYGLWIIGKERIPEGSGKKHLIRVLREVSYFENIRKVDFLTFLKKNLSDIRKLKNIILIKRTMSTEELIELMKKKNPISYISILLFPDFGFLFPWEKPHPYQPVETRNIERIRRVKDNLKRERINIIIIRGNDSIERFTYL